MKVIQSMPDIEQLLTEFHLQTNEIEAKHCGHDYNVDDASIMFNGGWEAGYEAWMFRDWLEDEGYTAILDRPRDKTVAIVEDVDTPDWVSSEIVGVGRVKLSAMGMVVNCDATGIDDGLDELKRDMWSKVSDVQGVGRKTLESMKMVFETPIHGVGSFKDVDGVGSKTAELLNARVMQDE